MSLYHPDPQHEHAARVSDYTFDLHVAWMQGKNPQWRRRPAAPDTIEGRRFALRQLDNWLPFGVCFASRDQIAAWIEHLEEGKPGDPGCCTEGEQQHRPPHRSCPCGWEAPKSANTIYSYESHVWGFYAWACDPRATEHGAVLDGNPVLGLPRHQQAPGIPHPVTEAELTTLLRVPEPLLTGVILGAWSGLRRGEMVWVRREEVDEHWTLISHGKGGKVGRVATHPYVWQHVKDRPPGWLLSRPDGAQITRAALACLARREFDKLGLTDVKLHELRHRYGTLIQRLYRDLLVTKRALRHKRLETTLVYCEVADESLGDAINSLPVPETGPASL